MTITVKRELDFHDLQDECWSGALDTLETIYQNDKEDALMSLLAYDVFSDTPDMSEVNDLLWFDSDWIFETLGINTEEEDDEDEDETEEEGDEENC